MSLTFSFKDLLGLSSRESGIVAQMAICFHRAARKAAESLRIERQLNFDRSAQLSYSICLPICDKRTFCYSRF